MHPVHGGNLIEDAKKTRKQLIEELHALRLEKTEQIRVATDKFAKAFLKNSIPAVIITAKEGTISEASDAFLRLVGRNRNEVVGHAAEKIGYITQEQRASFVDELNKNGRVENLEMGIKARSGVLRYGLFNAVMMSIHTEKYLLTTIQDITDRKLAEEALQTSENHFRELFDLAADGILIGSNDGIILNANSAFYEMSGLSPAEAIGKHISELNFDTEVMNSNPFRFDLLNQGFIVERQRVLIRPDGHKTHIEMRTKKFPDGGYQSIMRDITDRKKAEEKAQESLALLRIAGEKAKLGGWSVDLEENRVVWPDEVAAIHEMPPGYSPSLKDSIFFYAPEWRERMTKVFNDCAKKGISYDEEMEIITINGRRVWVKIIGEPVKNDTGKIIKVQGAFQDITERKRAELNQNRLEAQSRQLQKSESLGRMAGAIAHHFNNQLGVVIGNLEMTLSDQTLGVEQIANLTAAIEASHRAAQMSAQMLTYLGQSFDRYKPLNLCETCLECLPMLQAVMPGNVALETAFSSPGPTITGDPNQIQQVLTNLLTNAWEASGNNQGAISLNIKTVTPAEIPAAQRFPLGWQPRDPAYACLEVTDTGCGIAYEDIEKIFDPFFTSKFMGRGMGLPVVFGIVKAHGGIVTLESRQNIGSTFRIFFPVCEEDAPRRPDKTQHEEDVLIRNSPLPEIEQGSTVLLVEDQRTLRKLAAGMLKHLGFSVLEAKDGIEAVEVFRQRQNEIRLVFSDLTMPRMNGWEVLTAIRKLAPGVPVILTSGYDLARVMSGDHTELPQAFLSKPYTLKELNDAIQQASGSIKK